MLTDSQREALTARLRRGRESPPDGIPRRPAGLAELPLSYGQESLWFLDRLAPGQPTYNMPFTLRLSGRLNAAALRRALAALADRHEVLRTRLVAAADGRPVQVIDPPPASPSLPSAGLELIDLSGLAPDRRRAAAAEFTEAESVRPFILAEGPLLRTSLLRLADTEHVLIVVVHHTVFDGWSIQVFSRELPALYAAELTGEPSGLAELPIQFADYALWERGRLSGRSLAELEDYWRGVMDGFGVVEFPADRPRPALDSFDGDLVWHRVDRELLDRLRELSRREGSTLFATLLAALAALLSRYTGQADLVIGTASANRVRSELTPMLGYLVNMLPIRASLSGDPAFTELLARTATAMAEAFAHQDLPFGKLVDTLRVERDPSRAPVFEIAMTCSERDDAPVPVAGLDFLLDQVIGVRAAKFDLAFQVEAAPAGLVFECSYKTALFDQATIERLLGHLEVLLRGVAANPAARLSALPLLTERELRQELREWNDTAAPMSAGCVHEGIGAQAARAPDAVAAVYGAGHWSAAELNRRANQIARRLRQLGTGPETLVGVCLPAGLRRLAGLLGIWKAGGGYVPLDPELPASRLSFLLADTGMTVLLTDRASSPAQAEAGGVTVLSLDQEWATIGGLADGDLAGPGAGPANVAYVIYTSGSTGQPKGVVIEHRQAMNFLSGLAERWQINESSVALQFGSFTFDASVLDTFAPLLGGARLVLAPRQTLHTPARLAALIRAAGITFTLLPPALLSLIGDEQFPGLRVLMSGGEELPSDVARCWTRPGLRFVNAYGPTEATVVATCQELDGSTYPPPIGRANWPNCQVYVLDADLNPVPAGVIGELHVGGAGVARGYLNRPALTAGRFIADPFRPGARLYKTGDLVRRRPDGSIMFAGRADDQVQIRGYRVELGEIETALCTHQDVAQAVVTVRTDAAGEQQLAGYLRAAPGADPDPAALRGYLAGRLPGYMVPGALVCLAEFPVNASGKIDKTALPRPAPQRAAGRVEPATLIETVLADMFAALLGLDQVAATDSFFEIGGSSLRAMRLLAMLEEELTVELGVAEVFAAATPRRLAALLRDSHGLPDSELDAGDIAAFGEEDGEQQVLTPSNSG